MGSKEYSLLILGNFESVFIVQYVKNLKKYNPNAHLYFWGYKRRQSDTDRSFVACYDEYYLFDIDHSIDSGALSKLKSIIQLRKHFKKFVAGRHFDYINIHYIKPEYCFILDYIKKCNSKLILSPWGSDVYWPKSYYKLLVKRVFDSADFVTGRNNRFTRDYKGIFNVPDSKVVYCEVGIEPIEYIVEHKKLIDTNEAKRQLGIEGHYVITCGYKAMSSHQHFKMIDAIQQVRDKLPSNLLLLFPLTYPDDPEYIATIKQKVNEYGLNAVYFEHFLDIPHLFLMRQATDIFIHVQTTDASSASLCENILCEKKVINGAWLQYPELKKNGLLPYFEVDSIDNLGQTVLDVYHSEPIKIEEDVIKLFEKKQWKEVIKDWDSLFSGEIKHVF